MFFGEWRGFLFFYGGKNFKEKGCIYIFIFFYYVYKRLYGIYVFFIFSEVKIYDIVFDLILLSVFKKWKFEENGDLEDVKFKVVKVEEGGDVLSLEKKKKKKKEKRKSEELLEEGYIKYLNIVILISLINVVDFLY